MGSPVSGPCDMRKELSSCHPTVSIVLPVYNGTATLAAALRSLLLQTFQDWELLIIDDASLDDSLAVARSFADPRISVISHRHNRNLPNTLNEGVALARGRYIARMDQDDIAFPDRMLLQVAYLESHPEIDLVGSSAVVFSDSGECHGCLPVEVAHQEITRAPWNGIPLPHPTWMGRQEWFQQHPYDPLAAHAEDQDLLLRSHDHSRFSCLPEVLLGYRQNDRPFRKLYLARRSYARSVATFALANHRPLLALRAITLVIAKIAADALNVYAGITRLRNRLDPVPDEVAKQWRQLWTQVRTDVPGGDIT